MIPAGCRDRRRASSFALSRALAFAALHVIPKSALHRRLCGALSRGGLRFEPHFSGRVSLFLLAQRLLPRSRSSVALVPDYVCNIVARAFRLAGWRVIAYPTDERMEPQWEPLLAIADQHRAGVLVGASVFGSSGLLSFIGDPAKRDALKARSIHVVIDIAQDIRLLEFFPVPADDLVHGIVSFNDKSFPGAMGGGILSTTLHPVARTKQLSVGQILHLYASLLRKRVRGVIPAPARARSHDPECDYSTCDSYPYEIEGSCFELAKIQYVMALLGLRHLARYTPRKSALVRQGIHVPTRFAGTAAYVLVSRGSRASPVVSQRARKQPYALEDAPNASLRRGDVILHNKGFLDRR